MVFIYLIINGIIVLSDFPHHFVNQLISHCLQRLMRSRLLLTRVRRNRWPVASIFMIGPVKQNKYRPAGPIDILGPLGPATFVSSNR